MLTIRNRFHFSLFFYFFFSKSCGSHLWWKKVPKLPSASSSWAPTAFWGPKDPVRPEANAAAMQSGRNGLELLLIVDVSVFLFQFPFFFFVLDHHSSSSHLFTCFPSSWKWTMRSSSMRRCRRENLSSSYNKLNGSIHYDWIDCFQPDIDGSLISFV